MLSQQEKNKCFVKLCLAARFYLPAKESYGNFLYVCIFVPYANTIKPFDTFDISVTCAQTL